MTTRVIYGHDPECEFRREVVHYAGSDYCFSCGGELSAAPAGVEHPRMAACGRYEQPEHFGGDR